jgi:hypothetical protein
MAHGRQKIDIYRGRNPLDLPAYSLVECAHFLQVPAPTVRTWALEGVFNMLPSPSGRGVRGEGRV